MNHDDEALQRTIEKYVTGGMPSFILVLPDGKAQKIVLATEDDKAELYKMLD